MLLFELRVVQLASCLTLSIAGVFKEACTSSLTLALALALALALYNPGLHPVALTLALTLTLILTLALTPTLIRCSLSSSPWPSSAIT